MPLTCYRSSSFGLGDSYLLVVEDAMLDESPFVEAYLLSSEPRPPLRSSWILRPKASRAATRDMLAQIDLHDVALRWAARALDADEREWHRQQPPGTPFGPGRELAPCPLSAIITLWAEQQMCDELRAISDSTKSEQLCTFLVDLFDVPPLVIEPTGAEDGQKAELRMRPNNQL